jgi:hypothetical protein
MLICPEANKDQNIGRGSLLHWLDGSRLLPWFSVVASTPQAGTEII